ncbi:MAG: lytic transglycosylase domain-containing protein [Acidimicrobiales bacterium]
MPAPVVAAAAAKKLATRAVDKRLEQKPGGPKKSPLLRVLALGVAALLGVGLVPLFLFGAIGGPPPQTSRRGAGGLAGTGLNPVFVDAYNKAAARAAELVAGCKVRASAIAAIGKIESSHGRTDGGDGQVSPNGDVTPPIYGPSTPYGRAVGPMQFLESTWESSGQDGNGDGVKDPHNIFDAALATAGYLCRAVPGSELTSDDDLRKAFWSYNHSDAYVEDVLGWTKTYDGFLTAGGGTLVATGGGEAGDLLANPRLELEPEARADLENGNVDARLVAAVRAIVAEHSIYVYVFKTGHNKYVANSDRISNHYACDGCPGRAMDIGKIDGEWVNAQSSATFNFVRQLTDNQASLGIDEVGQPYGELVTSGPGRFRVFADGSHQDHAHVGIDGP